MKSLLLLILILAGIQNGIAQPTISPSQVSSLTKTLVNGNLTVTSTVGEIKIVGTQGSSYVGSGFYSSKGENQTSGLSNITNNTVSAFPNPTTDLVFFDSAKKINVYNINGQLIKSERLTNWISMKELPASIYTLDIDNRKVRIVKQ